MHIEFIRVVYLILTHFPKNSTFILQISNGYPLQQIWNMDSVPTSSESEEDFYDRLCNKLVSDIKASYLRKSFDSVIKDVQFVTDLCPPDTLELGTILRLLAIIHKAKDTALLNTDEPTPIQTMENIPTTIIERTENTALWNTEQLTSTGASTKTTTENIITAISPDADIWSIQESAVSQESTFGSTTHSENTDILNKIDIAIDLLQNYKDEVINDLKMKTAPHDVTSKATTVSSSSLISTISTSDQPSPSTSETITPRTSTNHGTPYVLESTEQTSVTPSVPESPEQPSTLITSASSTGDTREPSETSVTDFEETTSSDVEQELLNAEIIQKIIHFATTDSSSTSSQTTTTREQSEQDDRLLKALQCLHAFNTSTDLMSRSELFTEFRNCLFCSD